MPLCIRCSGPNPPQSSRCSQCGATLPRVAGEEPASSGLLSLEEGRTYSDPTQTFETENLVRLREYLEDFLAGGDDAPARDWLRRLTCELEEFNPGGIVRDVVNIVSPQTNPALKSESAGLDTAVNQGSKFIGNTPQEIRRFGH